MEHLLPYFTEGNLDQNMQILNDLFKMGRKVIRRKLSLRLTEDEVALIRDSLGRIRYYKNLYGRYKHVVKDLEISPFGYSALEDEIEAKNRRTGSREIETVRKTGRVSQNEMTAFAREQLERSGGDILFVSDSHATLYSQIEALHGMGHKDIGLIIFDKHTDYYLTNGSINKMQKRGDSTTVGGSLPLTKATFLGPLVDSGHVKGVGIIGVPDPNGIGRGSYAPTAEFQKQHADKIRVTALAPYARSHWVEKSLLPSLIADEVQFLRQAGVKHIALSLDIDVLRSSFFGYTSMEYSPLGHLVPLAMMDLKNLKPVSEVGIKPFMESLRSVLDIIGDSKKVRHLLPDTISPEDIKHMEHMQRTAVPEAGMPFSFIARSIKLLKAVCEEFGDIEFGVTLEHGNKYFGDITELSGRDYRRRLARLLYKYIQRVFEKNN